MKKISSLLVVFCLALAGLGAAAIQPNEDINTNILNSTVSLNSNQITIDYKEKNYVQVSLENQDNYLLNPGKPILPKKVHTFELPFGSSNIEVKVTPEKTIHQFIETQIQPSPAPLPLTPLKTEYKPVKKDETIYQSRNPYPADNYNVEIGVGVNEHLEHVTFVTIHYYPVQYTPFENKLTITKQADISISYTPPDNDHFQQSNTYDLVIITPEIFSEELQPLVNHKNNYDVKTLLKPVEDIYANFNGIDEAEQIKHFIYKAVEEYGIKYVLLVGGLKSTLFAKPRDNKNIGVTGWHIPVRYSNLRGNGDPGYPTDLYYADIYKYNNETEEYEFESWDYNGNNVFAEWPEDQGAPRDIADLRPDVAVGRLACSDEEEVSEVVNKIIFYETNTYGTDWFKKMIAISGDGFLDQFDLDIKWDTTHVSNGEYTICAQSFNDEGESGPVDEIKVSVNKSMESEVTFNHDDHLNPTVKNAIKNGYPTDPIAEIVSVSNGNILGYDNVTVEPSEGKAYCNTLFWWANVSYVNEILTIRGKSYDPKPYGNRTNIHVWVEDETGERIFSAWRNDTPMYYEGEWVTGEETVNGRGGALYYMPEEFKKEILWTSNGAFKGPEDVINSLSKGSGFAFFSGHGSPNSWGDQYPGIPGNRQHGSVTGLTVSNIRSIPPFISTPLFPMKELENTNKYPITVVGGCHNSLFNVSFIPSAIQYFTMMLGRNNYMWTYISAVPQCWSWYIVRLPESGAIASIGNTGLGWGWEGEFCTVGAGDGWISSEFFRQYGDHYGQKEFEKLGHVYMQTQTNYVNTFKDFTLPESWWLPDTGWDAIDQQAVEQWVLLGDPSLQIGGYQRS